MSWLRSTLFKSSNLGTNFDVLLGPNAGDELRGLGWCECVHDEIVYELSSKSRRKFAEEMDRWKKRGKQQ
jgi:hypothetical protein